MDLIGLRTHPLLTAATPRPPTGSRTPAGIALKPAALWGLFALKPANLYAMSTPHKYKNHVDRVAQLRDELVHDRVSSVSAAGVRTCTSRRLSPFGAAARRRDDNCPKKSQIGHPSDIVLVCKSAVRTGGGGGARGRAIGGGLCPTPPVCFMHHWASFSFLQEATATCTWWDCQRTSSTTLKHPPFENLQSS